MQWLASMVSAVAMFFSGIFGVHQMPVPAPVTSTSSPTQTQSKTVNTQFATSRAVSLPLGLSVNDWEVTPTLGNALLNVLFDVRLSRTITASIDFGDGSKPFPLDRSCSPSPDDSYGHRCTTYHVYTSPGTYTATLVGSNGQVIDAATIAASAETAEPFGTFDQDSLTTTSTIPMLTGTAVNVPYIRVLIPGDNNGPLYDSGTVTVTNNQWSVSIKPAPAIGDTLSFESYPVDLYGYSDSEGVRHNYSEGTHVLGFLASSTLTVNVWQSGPSATIDQDSLTQPENGSLTITGTASNTNEITLYVANFTNLKNNTYESGYQSFGYIEPVNGHWSRTLPNSNIAWTVGEYPVQVRDIDGNVLASGTLTISNTQQ